MANSIRSQQLTDQISKTVADNSNKIARIVDQVKGATSQTEISRIQSLVHSFEDDIAEVKGMTIRLKNLDPDSPNLPYLEDITSGWEKLTENVSNSLSSLSKQIAEQKYEGTKMTKNTTPEKQGSLAPGLLSLGLFAATAMLKPTKYKTPKAKHTSGTKTGRKRGR